MVFNPIPTLPFFWFMRLIWHWFSTQFQPFHFVFGSRDSFVIGFQPNTNPSSFVFGSRDSFVIGFQPDTNPSLFCGSCDSFVIGSQPNTNPSSFVFGSRDSFVIGFQPNTNPSSFVLVHATHLSLVFNPMARDFFSLYTRATQPFPFHSSLQATKQARKQECQATPTDIGKLFFILDSSLKETHPFQKSI